MTDFDLCVIGGGPAGFAAAVRAWDYGKRVCLIEKNELGGAGVHHGALSSKTYWELSRDYLNAQRQDRGFHADALHVDLGQVTKCVRTAVDEKTRQLQTQMRALAKPDDGHGGSITLVEGTARFVDPNRIEVDHPDGRRGDVLTAANFVIATGSRPRTPSLEARGATIHHGSSLKDLRVVDDTRTSPPHIYAVGDTTFDIALANVAELEGRHAVPAVTEGLQDCVRMLLGTSTYRPHVFGGHLRLSRVTFDD